MPRNLLEEAPSRELHGIPAHAAQLVDRADVAGRAVLDVGCGFGWFELVALDRGAERVVGLEPSDGDLATARRHVRDERASFVVGSAAALPFASESFDTVVCFEVLEHLPRGSEPQAFAEFARVLRPGGALYLSTPHAAAVACALDPAFWLIAHRHYRRQRLAELAAGVGLAVERLEVRGRAWLLASILDLYVAKWVFRRRPFFESAVDRRVDREMLRRDGYANVFLRARRPH